MLREFDASTEFQLPEVEPGAALIPIASLLLAGSPRSVGADVQHIRALAESGADLPPIIVQRGTNRVIDGLHRVHAARLRGQDIIEVRYFDGTDQDAFVLAVRANVEHGLPLPLADRRAAAQRILRDHPLWSDRVIAHVAGLSAKTVAGIRKHGGESGQTVRVGRDGRVRPLNAALGRQRAREFLDRNPAASLRQISAAAGISVGTARDVRDRYRQETPAVARAGSPDAFPAPVARSAPPRVVNQALRSEPSYDPSAALRVLRNDPSLRHTESGRLILRMLAAIEMNSNARERLIAGIPAHCVDVVADLATANALMWQGFVAELDERRTMVPA